MKTIKMYNRYTEVWVQYAPPKKSWILRRILMAADFLSQRTEDLLLFAVRAVAFDLPRTAIFSKAGVIGGHPMGLGRVRFYIASFLAGLAGLSYRHKPQRSLNSKFMASLLPRFEALVEDTWEARKYLQLFPPAFLSREERKRMAAQWVV